MLKIAAVVVLGGLLYRLLLAVGRRSRGSRPDEPSLRGERKKNDSGKVVDADFREIE